MDRWLRSFCRLFRQLNTFLCVKAFVYFCLVKILIIDNEQPIRKELRELILSTSSQITSLEEADGVTSGLKAIQNIKPDVVFLDVEMDDGTGIELVKQLGANINFQLIFITAHNKYAIDAFKLSAIDFLLKPIDPSELTESLRKAEKNLKSHFLESQLQILQDSITDMKRTDAKIALKDSEAIYFVKVSDIIRCEASGAYTVFHISGHKDIIMSKGIKEYEDLLKQYDFFRTHHSHLVNLKKISRFDKAEGGTLVLENSDKVPVSHRKRESLLQLLSNC